MGSLSLARSGLAAAAVAALAVGTPLPAAAAEVTRIATAFEADNPFDLDLTIGFERTQRRGRITRENHQATQPGGADFRIADVTELRYHAISQSLPMRVAFGIFHDLELHVGTQMVFNDDRLWRYPGLDANGQVVTDAGNSTITNNCLASNGTLVNPTCTAASPTGAVPIFNVPGGSHHGGLDNFTLGIAWAPFNDQKDDTKPKWLLGFDYTLPSALANKPNATTSDSNRSSVGDKVHRFAFTTALSKRLGSIDPYVKLSYTLPVAAPGAWNICTDVDRTSLPFPANCDTGWSSKEIGIKPPHLANLLFGAEFYAYDEPARHQQVGFDIQAGVRYVSEGRYYNELSDALGKLLYNEEYLTVGGSIGIYARAAEYVQLKLTASLYHDTEHYLTNEPVGKDIDGACKGDRSSTCVDLDNRANEINPSFDFRYDMPGRRFRISEVNVFTVMALGVVSF